MLESHLCHTGKDRPTLGDKALFVAVLLLTILDIFESGSGTWVFHLEGAKLLLDAGVMADVSEWDGSAGTSFTMLPCKSRCT